MEEKAKKKKPFLWVVIGIVLLAVLYFGIKAIYNAIIYESTDNAQIQSNATPVLSRIAGYIDSVKVDDYQNVKEGQYLVKIDDRELAIALEQVEADMLNAQADLSNATATNENTTINKRVVAANLQVQQVRLEKAMSDFDRDEALYKDGSITQRQYVDSKANYETNLKQYLAAKDQVDYAASQINTSQAQIEKAKAAIKTRQAGIDNAKLRLSYTRIEAPVTGKVGTVNLQKGQYVQPGQPLFTIVNNEEFWVIANFKETQLKSLKIGQPVKIEIDGYPKLDIEGKVASFSEATGAKFALLPPDNATGNFVKVTQRVPVKITFNHPEQVKDVLKAGLSVEVHVLIKD